jgi:RNA methyltransferase, TrmH family
MGWERQGMSDGQRAPCDLTVHLPMVGAVDSLNLAVATGVMLYQIHTRLRARDAPT